MNDRNPRDEGRPYRGKPQGGDRPNRGKPQRDGDRSARSGDGARRDGERPSRGKPARDGERSYRDKPQRDGDRSYRDRPQRDGERSYRDKPQRDGDRPYRDRPQRDGERPYRERTGRDGERSRDDRSRRDGDRPYRDRTQRDGERPYRDKPQRDGDRPYRGKPARDGGDRSYAGKPRRDGDRPYRDDRPRRDGEPRPYRGDRPQRDGDRPYRDRPRRDDAQPGRGGTRGAGRSDRGGRDREFTEAERLQHELRPVRAEHDDPAIPDYVKPQDLHPAARNQLKTLQLETQELVSRHLAMVVALIEDDPELAHQHAISASRRAGRIPVAREMLAATAYRIGDYALALRELRTYRRLSGSQGNIALMVEAERALGRPQKAIETGLEADLTTLETEQRVQLAIAMSGARLDLGQTQQALFELEISALDPTRAFSYSPELFAAYAGVLEELGRDREAAEWQQRAERAAAALDEQFAAGDEIEVYEIIEHEHDQVHDEPETEEPLAGPVEQTDPAPDAPEE